MRFLGFRFVVNTALDDLVERDLARGLNGRNAFSVCTKAHSECEDKGGCWSSRSRLYN